MSSHTGPVSLDVYLTGKGKGRKRGLARVKLILENVTGIINMSADSLVYNLYPFKNINYLKNE